MGQHPNDVIAALTNAIAVMRDGEPPKAAPIAPQWDKIGRVHITKWLDDFARLLLRGRTKHPGSS